MEQDEKRKWYKWRFERINLKDKYRLGIYNDTTFEQLLHFRLTGRGMIIALVLSSVLLIIGTTILIAFTPLREFIPGYPDSGTRRMIINNAAKVDSLETLIVSWEGYIDNFSRIVTGENPPAIGGRRDSTFQNNRFHDSRSPADSLLRVKVEQEEQFNLAVTESNKIESIFSLYLFPPVKGVISSHFDLKNGKIGIDIIAEPSSFVASTLDGTVTFANWTVDNGWVIQVQHQDDILSIYKHNAKLLRQIGDRVKAGDAIAILGSTIDSMVSPYLHFELWHKGVPVDPKQYISF